MGPELRDTRNSFFSALSEGVRGTGSGLAIVKGICVRVEDNPGAEVFSTWSCPEDKP